MSSGRDRIDAVFAAARSEGRAALMPYMVAGFPDRETSLAVARAYVEGGADLVEVGVPFSDPVADGPVIHAAATEALRQGSGLDTALDVVRELGEGVPAVLMCYVNMILVAGPERFAGQAAEAGVAGVIVPDLPQGEAPEIEQALRDRGIAPIFLIAPTTTPERRAEICELAEGFIYLVSTVGTTGERTDLPEDLRDLIEGVRSLTTQPVAVGFGIGSPAQAATVGEWADGVIIGSRLVRIAADGRDSDAICASTADFLSSAREALKPGSAGG